jgi:hypothetical protein
MRKAVPQGYEGKFAGFIRACDKAKAEKIPHVIVAQPQVLGDTYEEVIESLWRLSDAGLALLITGEKDARPRS